MSRLPSLKPAQVIRALERAGFVVHHTKGSHYFLKHPDKQGSAGDSCLP
ncbi:MAG: type II toxin-antitoxin system HicA family toxin [Bryobacterales bacterium]|nr:type II toxin-antitoxin system HicA family toxin [Bryobacterales bacterium]